LQTQTFNASFHAVGVGEELAELQEALIKSEENRDATDEACRQHQQDIVAEAGDVCWYFSQMLAENGVDMGEIVDTKLAKKEADVAAATMSEVARPLKRSKAESASEAFRHVHMAFGSVLGKQKRLILGKHISREELVTVYREAFATLSSFIVRKIGVPMADVLKYNNRKLVDRLKRGVIIGDGDHR